VSDQASSTNVGHLLRDLAPQVLGVLARRHDDFAAAEDAVQDALIAAAEQWASDGVPANPGGWLYHVALRRLTDRMRSELARRRREEAVASELWAEWAFVPPADAELHAESDDSLALLFMCCHPALSPPSAIALTLRAVGGLTTAEIASAFIVPEATMAQRISRAKQSVRGAGASFTMPDGAERSARLGAVMHVLYLMFNEGHTSSAGPALHRVDLSGEAIRLARMLRGLVPDDAEAIGLLALMLLTDARRDARTTSSGALVPLDEQDRTLWDRAKIAEGIALVEDALPRGTVGPYQLQAAIAAVHDEAPSAADTDWAQILTLYGLLARMSDNPMVKLNEAVAGAMVHGPAAGLAMVDGLESDRRIAGHYRLAAVRAHLYEKLGEHELARTHYLAAAELTASLPERDYLVGRAIRCAAKLAGVRPPGPVSRGQSR
jgi:RNA polymerase sigma factor (sigma-70 family)